MKLNRILAAVLMAGAFAVGPSLAVGAEGYKTLDNGTVTNTKPATGESVTLVFNGFAPTTWVTVELRSDPVVLGKFMTDANGVLRVTVTIPAGTPAGNHSVVATGVDAQGTPVMSSVPVTVTSSAATTTPTQGTTGDTGSTGGTFLPRTGTDVAALLTVGGVLLAAGTVAVTTARRRPASEAR